MQANYVILNYLVATLKDTMKQVKLIFTNIVYLNSHYLKLSFYHVINITKL